jgi:hypothetical protein
MLVERKRNCDLRDDVREILVSRIQEVNELTSYHDRRHSQNGRPTSFNPPISGRLRVRISFYPPEVVLREDPHAVWDYSSNHHVTDREVLTSQVNQILQDRKRDTISHVYDSPTGGIPASTYAPSSFAVQTGVNRPADSKYTLHD